MRRIYLVSCVSRKLPHPVCAKDLYVSPWFRAARRYVEATGDPWYILSAKHGLLHPETVIEPYDESLIGADKLRRLAWAHRVLRAMPDTDARVVILAGRSYAQVLAPTLHAELPLAGLGIGQQLAWFKAREGGK